MSSGSSMLARTLRRQNVNSLEWDGGAEILQREHDAATRHDALSATVAVVEGDQIYWLRAVRSLQHLESFSGQLALWVLPEFTPTLLILLLGTLAVVVLTAADGARRHRDRIIVSYR